MFEDVASVRGGGNSATGQHRLPASGSHIMRRPKIMIAVAFAGLAALAAAAAPKEDAVTQAREAIWAKEMAIYEGRSRGSVDYYVNNTSPNFLAWTAGTPAPFRVDRLRAGGAALRGHDKEIITTTFRDFSLSGDTAIIYYQNHRTRTADGAAVDQTYDNIHVWQKTGGDWKVLASMSRQMPTP